MSDAPKKPEKKSPADNNMNGNVRVLRIPGAVIFWLLLLGIFALMYFWKDGSGQKVAQWDQTQF